MIVIFVYWILLSWYKIKEGGCCSIIMGIDNNVGIYVVCKFFLFGIIIMCKFLSYGVLFEVDLRICFVKWFLV